MMKNRCKKGRKLEAKPIIKSDSNLGAKFDTKNDA